MPRQRKWTDPQLIDAVAKCTSLRQVLIALKLRETGGNYIHIWQHIHRLDLITSHFTGQAWNKGQSGTGKPKQELTDILVYGSSVQSFKLKKRLFNEGIKQASCELCGWSKRSLDGRIPLELDHINGDRHDNRLSNLRILCPNCHSLQITHRGKNKQARMAKWQTRNT